MHIQIIGRLLDDQDNVTTTVELASMPIDITEEVPAFVARLQAQCDTSWCITRIAPFWQTQRMAALRVAGLAA